VQTAWRLAIFLCLPRPLRSPLQVRGHESQKPRQAWLARAEQGARKTGMWLVRRLLRVNLLCFHIRLTMYSNRRSGTGIGFQCPESPRHTDDDIQFYTGTSVTSFLSHVLLMSYLYLRRLNVFFITLSACFHFNSST
jgi:hypothetical protein